MSKDKKYRNIAEMLFDGIIAFFCQNNQRFGGNNNYGMGPNSKKAS